MTTMYIPNDVVIQGSLNVTGTMSEIARSRLVQDALAVYEIDLTSLRIHDAPQTNLPGTSSGNDLGLYGTTFGSDVMYLATADLKNAGATSNYARGRFTLPPEYETGHTVKVRLRAGMKTTVASASATVDVEAFISDKFGAVSGGDLVTTAATTCNSLTPGDKDFDLTATSLAPGVTIDFRITSAVNDSGTGTAVIGAIGAVQFLLDIRG